ncbi:MAG TPA: hypothetical protein VLC46_01145 [Thermoanaerobaculia bacterium]|nr:hypothetical protein [Thermoanaerobaculia bacterium]
MTRRRAGGGPAGGPPALRSWFAQEVFLKSVGLPSFIIAVMPLPSSRIESMGRERVLR